MRKAYIGATVLLVGCPHISTDLRDEHADPDGDGVPWNHYLHEYGVAFSEEGDCIEADATDLFDDRVITVELYLHAAVGTEQTWDRFPLVVWPGFFAFYEQAGRLVVTADQPIEPDSDNSGPYGFMDGGAHHVAFTHDDNLIVYVDGYPHMVVGTDVDSSSTPSSSLYIGCWPDEEGTFVGTIGELRLYGSDQYNGSSFDPDWEPYGGGDQTLALWRFDEGEGDTTYDEESGRTAAIEGATWAPFDLACRLENQDDNVECGPRPQLYCDLDNDGIGGAPFEECADDESNPVEWPGDCDDDPTSGNAGSIEPGQRHGLDLVRG